MSNQNQADEQKLRSLFVGFIDAGLHGRFEEAISLIGEPYTGVGMGEQGIVRNKDEARKILQDGYRPTDGTIIQYHIKELSINFMNEDVAVLLSEVDIINQPPNSEPMHSGIVQTIGARRRGDDWCIAFTHASPTVLTVESVEAYPVRFMENAIAQLKRDNKVEPVLDAEVNLTQNTVVKLKRDTQESGEEPGVQTLDELVHYGIEGELSVSAQQEYHVFWSRRRLLGLFAEGVTQDHFDYRMRTEQGNVWLRCAVEMIRQACSGDVIAVVTYNCLDSQKLELEQFAREASHDALTGILNRSGFEQKVADLLQEYAPQNNTALFMIDLDDFKQINDRLGHQMGDTVLHQVAGVLQNTFRNNNAVGRVGGDEFMALLTGDFSLAFLEKKADELLNSMRLHMGGSKQIPVSVSIGIAYGRSRATFEKLYRIADIALYTAKKAGKCRYHLISADTNAERSYSGAGSNLLSLQTLLDYTDGKDIVQSRTPYEALVENIPGSVLVISLADKVRITHCNDWTSRFTGFSKEEIEELQRDDALALTHPDDLPLMQEIIRQVYAGLEIVRIIYRIRRKDGTYRHTQINASMTERTKNELIFHGIETDVEEVFQLKQKMEDAHNKLEALLNTIPGSVLIISLADRVELEYCNSWIFRFLGYGQEEANEMKQGDALALVHPDDIQTVEEAIERMRIGVKDVNSVYRLRSKDGGYRHVRNNASLIECHPDKSIYYSIVTDVEELIAAENKLEYSRKQLEALLTAIPGGIAVFEITDTVKVTQYGTWFCKFTGYQSDEESARVRQGKQLATVCDEDRPKTREALRRVCEDGVDNIFISVRIKCKDAPPKWADIHGSVFERAPGKVTMYVIYTGHE